MERAGAGLGGIGSNGHAASHAPSNAPAEKDTASLHGSFSTNNSNMVATGASNQTVNPPATLPTSSTSTSTALPTPSSGNGNVKVHSEARIAHIARTELRRALKAALNSETATTVPGQPGTTSAFSNSNGLDNSNGAAAAATTTTAAGSATATEAQEAPESIALFLNSFMRKFLEQKLFSVVRDMIEPHLRELVEEVVGEQMEGRVPQVKEEMKEEGSGIEGMKEELRKELGEQLRAELRAENTAWLAGEREKLKRELLSELSANNPPAPKPKDQPPDAELEDPLVAQPVSRSTSPSLDNDRSRSRTASPAPEPALNLPKPSKKRDPKSPFARLDAHFKDYFKSDGKRLEVVLGALRYGTELHGRVVAWGQEFNRRHNPRRSGSYLIDDDVLPLFLSELRTAMPFLWDPTWIPDAGLVKKKERDSLDGTSARKPVSREGKNTPKNSEKRKVEDSESERKKPKEKKRKEKEPGANAFLETKPKCDCGLLVFAGRSKDPGPNNGRLFARCGKVVPKCKYFKWLKDD